VELRNEVMQRAVAKSENSKCLITQEDRCPVIFCSMAEFENTTLGASASSFRAAVDLAASKEREGFLFSSVHDEVAEAGTTRQEYPFNEDLGSILPWWASLEAARIAENSV
jgi:hypothetical protein